MYPNENLTERLNRVLKTQRKWTGWLEGDSKKKEGIFVCASKHGRKRPASAVPTTTSKFMGHPSQPLSSSLMSHVFEVPPMIHNLSGISPEKEGEDDEGSRRQKHVVVVGDTATTILEDVSSERRFPSRQAEKKGLPQGGASRPQTATAMRHPLKAWNTSRQFLETGSSRREHQSAAYGPDVHSVCIENLRACFEELMGGENRKTASDISESAAAPATSTESNTTVKPQAFGATRGQLNCAASMMDALLCVLNRPVSAAQERDEEMKEKEEFFYASRNNRSTHPSLLLESPITDSVVAMLSDVWTILRRHCFVNAAAANPKENPHFELTQQDWFSWLQGRTQHYARSSTHRDVASLRNPLLDSQLMNYDSKLKEKCTEATRSSSMSLGSSASFFGKDKHGQEEPLSYAARLKIISRHFRSWKFHVKHVVLSRVVSKRLNSVRQQTFKQMAFLQWKLGAAASVVQRRMEDFKNSSRILQQTQKQVMEACEELRCTQGDLRTAQLEIIDLQGANQRLEVELLNMHSPMVFDFRKPIRNASVEDGCKILNEGVIYFKNAAVYEDQVHQHGSQAVPALFDLMLEREREGIAAPTLTPLSSHYVIRVEDHCSINTFPGGGSASGGGCDGMTIFDDSLSLQLLNEACFTYCRQYLSKMTPTTIGWQAKLLLQYETYQKEVEAVRVKTATLAHQVRFERKTNTALVMEESKIVPSFFLKSLEDVKRHPQIYFAAGMNWVPTAMGGAINTVRFQWIRKKQFEEKSFGLSNGEIYEMLNCLGCNQQITAEDFSSLEDDVGDTVHRLAISRILSYALIVKALEKDQTYRVSESNKKVNANKGVTAMTEQRGSELLLPAKDDEHKKSNANEQAAIKSPQATSLLSPSTVSLTPTAPGLGPSGVLRNKQCKTLLEVVNQRHGIDHTEDTSATEILQWLREGLEEAQYRSALQQYRAQKKKEQATSSVTPRKSLVGGGEGGKTPLTVSPSKSGDKSTGHSKQQRKQAAEANLDEIERTRVNIRNLDEDLGPGLDLIKLFVQHLLPMSHTEPSLHIPTADECMASTTTNSSSINSTTDPFQLEEKNTAKLMSTAEYLCRVALEEFKCHLPGIVREKLYLCTPSIKLMYLTCLYNVLHRDTLVGSVGTTANAQGAMATGSNVPPTLSAINLTPLSPYLSTTGHLPLPRIAPTRFISLFGKTQKVEAVLAHLNKLWPLLYAWFNRFAILTECSEQGQFCLSLMGAATLVRDNELLICSKISSALQREESSASIAPPHSSSSFLASANTITPWTQLQFLRTFLQTCCMNEDELVEDMKDIKVPWTQVPSHFGETQMESSFLTLSQFAEWIVRLSIITASGEQSPSSSLISSQEFYAKNFEASTKFFRTISTKTISACQNYQHEMQAFNPNKRGGGLSRSGFGSFSKGGEVKPNVLPPFCLSDPRVIRTSLLFSSDIQKILHDHANSILVPIFIRFSFFTKDSWRLLEQRMMDVQLWLKCLDAHRLFDVTALGASSSSLINSPTNARRVFLESSSSMRSPTLIASTLSKIFENGSSSALTIGGCVSGLSCCYNATLSSDLCAKVFSVVAVGRQAAQIGEKVIAGKVPAMCEVSEASTLQVGGHHNPTPSPGVSPSRGGNKPIGVGPSNANTSSNNVVLTLGYSGFCEAIVALALMLYPLPWISHADRVLLTLHYLSTVPKRMN